jgi:hypothetical protein
MTKRTLAQERQEELEGQEQLVLTKIERGR